MTTWHEQHLAAAKLNRPALETDATSHRSGPGGWVGWILFAAVMLIMLGGFQAILGLVGLFDGGFFAAHRNGQVVVSDYRTWGVAHLILAVIAVGTGIGLLLALTWARIVGVFLCVVNVIVSFAFLGAYPWWAVLVIAFSVITAYAITVHGGDIGESFE